ncbi:SDR family oxidoreductase [Spongiibacter sp.]|mgnify:FL=1|uniref:SDR family oxidoreductase n=1 Tax=Spongiibacter sp. TaxID=2024860 RepID=UPI00257C1709|nr:SDR family oxidoreductase [Spongiibacter sp.]
MMQGKVCLITGATNGIGRATAKALVEQGAELFIVCRNRDKGEALLAELRALRADAALTLLIADLGKMADIRRAAQEFLDTGKPLHLLLNNAGVVNTERKLSADGIEETFAVNHLAYFLMTELLRQRLIDSAPSRIVSVASEAHAFAKGVQFDDPEFANHPYKTFKVYGHSKLCNILWTRELAKQLAGTGVTVNCVHPGAVSTGLGQQDGGLMARTVSLILKPFFRSPDKGASTSIYVATSPSLEGVTGEYFADCKPKRIKPWGKDDAAAEKLWQLSEDYVRRA